MPETIEKNVFTQAYATRPPWDIDEAQPCFRAAAAKVTGRLLDSGCGSGENALFFAARGLDVTGLDYLDAPVDAAEAKANERGLEARFLVKDALALDSWDERFDVAIDSGLFHVFGDADRARYVKGLAHVVKPGGLLMLLCFSERTPGDQGPRRVTQSELRASFADGWTIESIEPATFETRPEWRKQLFADLDPVGWFLTARRSGS